MVKSLEHGVLVHRFIGGIRTLLKSTFLTDMIYMIILYEHIALIRDLSTNTYLGHRL